MRSPKRCCCRCCCMRSKCRSPAVATHFASHHFRHLITKLDAPRFSKLRLRLQTNGLLLDEEAWTDLRLDGRVDSIWISIDAAHADTYERLRRGGSFERLLRNLDFVSRLRRERRFRFL